jgi:hypothetical protein
MQPRSRDADTKLAQSRLSVLELARELSTSTNRVPAEVMAME